MMWQIFGWALILIIPVGLLYMAEIEKGWE